MFCIFFAAAYSSFLLTPTPAILLARLTSKKIVHYHDGNGGVSLPYSSHRCCVMARPPLGHLRGRGKVIGLI